jgi:hypothetical protein
VDVGDSVAVGVDVTEGGVKTSACGVGVGRGEEAMAAVVGAGPNGRLKIPLFRHNPYPAADNIANTSSKLAAT